MKYKRVLLKLSGEALMGSRQYGIDNDRLVEYAKEIKKVVDAGVELAIVIGGGNIFRGVAGAAKGMDRVQGDYMGVLAYRDWETDRKSTRLNSSHITRTRMPSSA